MESQSGSSPEPAPFTPGRLLSIEESLGDSHFLRVFDHDTARRLVGLLAQDITHNTGMDEAGTAPNAPPSEAWPEAEQEHAVRLGLACLAAFLQANVTGPVLERPVEAEAAFVSAFDSNGPSAARAGTDPPMARIRSLCQRSLDIDGVSAYPYIPYIELFCLARFIFTSGQVLPTRSSNPLARHLSWTRLRIHLWHYKLLAQPSLGPGSLYTKSGRWTDVATLQERIGASLLEAESAVFGGDTTDADADAHEREHLWPPESRVHFRLEEAHCHILLGNDAEARQAVQAATQLSGLAYALSGALGKRTRFQENSISQLVVLAKSLGLSSAASAQAVTSQAAPAALALNDDTLLEKVEFGKNENPQNSGSSSLPPQLLDVTPDKQPELAPEDQIILLTEATLRDTFSPADALTSEEILPFAARVINDRVSNWQIYTQALLVRSRIELNRSRTVERGVLQMQAVVDQVIVDTQESPDAQTLARSDVPSVTVTPAIKTGSFLPAAKPSESASARDRLRYVNTLASPPRWHLESELAFAWTAIGSLVSALEIFKRLHLWPEVALCLASAGSSDDPDGRGAGGEDKARAVVRWQLFHRTSAESYSDEDAPRKDEVDVDTLRVSDFYGPERSPPPPNAPRLWCILGDLENEAEHYRRAWAVSNRRFARAQKSLAELHTQKREWAAAREAYRLATGVNRLSPELWSRLGDVELRLGSFPDAAQAFRRAIAAANDAEGGEGARTWSNLGTALLSWHREVVAEGRERERRRRRRQEADDKDNDNGAEEGEEEEEEEEDTMASTRRAASPGRVAPELLVRDALVAFKRGATIADSNWRIWDNVVTLAASLASAAPGAPLGDVVLGVANVLRIRRTEAALDLDVLTLLVRNVTEDPAPPTSGEIYDPPRSTDAGRVVRLFEDAVVPLLTTDSAAWALVARLRAWRRDWAGALDAAEKGWRAATSGAASAGAGDESDWLTSRDAWDAAAQRTAELAAAYENYGARISDTNAGGEGEGVDEEEKSRKKWRGKARTAVRGVLGRAREAWGEGDANWDMLRSVMEDLR
ncbi:hypothetical protein GGR56DRAFT_684399 [Xylariaceae sp. FL0804]|nr:hypothetical protein GGR56DRAFT_684399 [Xylariaceae sp. FL0804]